MSNPEHTTAFVPLPSGLAPGDTADATAPMEGAALPVGPTAGGRYQLQSELARGGMGIVYRAIDTILDREVALKVLQERFAGYSSVANRFIAEAQITGQLQHPGIPAVHDLGTLPDGRPFLAMKLVKGRTLAQLLSDRPDPSAERGRWLAVFEQLCQAVAYAHAHQVIHRDLKPANVMVGSFGEVQVMDWGLAKVLPPAGVAPEPGPAEEGAEPGTEIRTRREEDSSATQTGSLLGTPAYMPPEQAAGEIAKVDERADVFGLGAILCVLLTGQPPYAGRNSESIRLMAVRGQLDDCLSRLEGCGAEPGLVELCRRCLAFEPADRPRDAGVVAQEVAALRAQAEERARQAELERVRAEVAVREQRKRRRVQLALAATLLLVVGLVGGGWTWWRWQAQSRRARAERGAALALAKADQLAEQAGECDRTSVAGAEATVGLWRQAVAAAEQAEGVAFSAGDRELAAGVTERAEALQEGLVRAEADLSRARRDAILRADLDRARGRLARTAGGDVDWAGAAQAYQDALQTAGLPAGAGPEELAAAIQAERPGVREALVSALDQWADCLKRGPEQDRLRSAADQADGDPLRRQIRSAITGRDRAELLRLAETVVPADLPVVTAVLLGQALRNQRQPQAAERLLRAARVRYPADFEVLEALGSLLADQARNNPVRVEEAVGCMRSALALRPDSPRALLNLGWTLSRKGDWPEAEACFRKTLRLVPNYAMAHNNLGNALFNQNDLDGAIACCRRAIDLDPRLALAHGSLGLALYARKDLDGAIACFRQAIDLDPSYAKAHLNLGNALRDKPDLEGAIACYRQAIHFNPSYALAHRNLGDALREQKDVEGAIASYRQALRLNPNFAGAQVSLGTLLHNHKKDVDGAITCFRQAIQINPNNPTAHFNLGIALRAKQDLAGAIASFRRATQLDPSDARAHSSLGYALHLRRDLEGAVTSYRKALDLDPNDFLTPTNLGMVLREKQDLEGAIACFRRAIELNPRYAAAHIQLGIALRASKDVEGAIACYRQALDLQPSNALAHLSLGNALKDRQDREGAGASYRKAIELAPDYALAYTNLVQFQLEQGRWSDARDGARSGLERVAPKDPLRPTLEQQLAESEQLLAVAPKLPAVLAGEDPSAGNRERLVLAQACIYSKHTAAAARLYAAALTADPAAANDHRDGPRYNAACCAALAGCGQGEDAVKLPAADRDRWRAQALTWLRSDLAAWKKELTSSLPANRSLTQQALAHWLADADFNGVRPGPQRIDLPAKERADWDAFWDEVRSTLAEARKPAPPKR